MIKIELSHWSRRLLVFFPTHRGVEGFVINGWDLSNLGYSQYIKNLGDKSHIIIIRDVFHDGTWVYRGPYSTKPGDKHRPIWNVTSGWDLSYMGGCVIYGLGLSNMASYLLRYCDEIRREYDFKPIYDKAPHIRQIPPRYDKPHPYMTTPIVYFFVRVTP